MMPIAAAIPCMTRCLTAVALSVSILLGASIAIAQDSGPDFLKVIGREAGSSLPLRSGPGEEFDVLAEVPFDAVALVNLGCEGGLSFAEWQQATPEEREAAAALRWCQVEYQGTVGWVAGQFVGEDTSSYQLLETAIDPIFAQRWDLVETSDGDASGGWLALLTDGAVIGNTGCNMFQTHASVEGDRLVVEPIATTLALCADPALQDQEDLMLSILSGSATFQIDRIGGRALLLLSDVGYLGFERNPLFATEWVLESIDGDAVDSISAWIELAPDGSLSGRTGCNVLRGSVTLTDGALAAVQMSMTRAACPNPQYQRVEDSLLAALEEPGDITFDEHRLALADQANSVALVFVASGRAEPMAYLSVTGEIDELTVRAAPEDGANGLTTILPGTVIRLRAFSEDGEWSEITLVDQDITGWVFTRFLGPANSAVRAGQGVFEETGFVSCAQTRDAPMSQCSFSVARDPGGNATIVVTRPDGRDRALFFMDAEFLGADTSEADGYHDSSAQLVGGIFRISVGPERYEILSALVLGR